ncbi:MAG: hypothetical protein E7646_08945, partial [Ruminococcaceae bacterium]|nr:hypothetical protein [Oscillospiraceae bacterium]
ENNGEKQQIAAYYPYTETTNGSVAITLPEAYDANYDQYDYLYGEYARLSSNPAIIKMKHLMAKVTVTVASTGNDVAGDDAVEGIALADVPRTATWTLPGDTLAEFGDGEFIDLYYNKSSYTGYALPTEAQTLTLRITMESGRIFTATVSSDDLTTNTEGLESAVHYKLGIRVGKDKVEITDVNVTPWAEKEIDGGVAKEVFSYIDATAMNADELNAAVTKALETGETDIEVTLKPDAPAEMITAIRRAICDTEGVADGSINLTLKGVTTIPGTTSWDGVAFGSGNMFNGNGDFIGTEYLTQLASVTLPDVTVIGDQAFCGCSKLTSITAPKVQSIGHWGFDSTSITSIDMPLLKELGKSAFRKTALTEVYLPSLEEAGDEAFLSCEQLRTVDLPKLQTLRFNLFQYCTSLVSVNVPAVTDMKNYVFDGCSELVSITLPGVTDLAYSVFRGCTKLENITLGSVITIVNGNLFEGEALSSNITLTLHPDQANAEGDLKATAGTNVTWAGFTWKEVKFSATE